MEQDRGPEMNPHTCGQLICVSHKEHSIRKVRLQQLVLENRISMCERMNYNPYLTKINWK
jgi:hypothetical protein